MSDEQKPTETPEPIDPPNDAWVFLLMLVMVPYVLFKDWMMRLRKKEAGQ